MRKISFYKYLPILAIYFANGFQIFSQIAENFWIKNSLTISASEVIAITIWANLPWSMKIVFGQILDSVRILGSQRNVYIIIGAISMLIGNMITIAITTNYQPICSLLPIYNLLIISAFLIQLGIVLQDLIADTLCYEVIDKKYRDNDEGFKKEVNKIQYIARIVNILACIIAITISGYISSRYSYKHISFFIPIVSIISILGVLIARTEPKVPQEKINPWIATIGVVYLISLVFIPQLSANYSLELILVIGTTLTCFALYRLSDHLSAQKKKELFAVLLIFFTFRAAPSYGPGVEWWKMDVLKFSPEFFAHLSQISLILGFLGVVFFGKKIINYNVMKSVLLLNTIGVLLQLPFIAMAFGFHEWTQANFGFGAQTIALVDATAASPFQNLGFLIMCAAITYYAPRKNAATWFALVFSLMSIAYISASRIIKKMIANSFLVERGSYENIATQMIVTSSINFLLPSVIIALVIIWDRRNGHFLSKSSKA